MDSLTQGLLGATTFAIIKDKEIGKKSLLIGAIAGTIPDLDVFLAPWFNDIEFLTVHRSVSHSVGFALILSLLLAAIFYRWYERKQSFGGWFLAFFLAVMTHSLLDWCTTYGTKLLSPFNGHLFSTNNIHVLEPIYTSILLIGTLILLFRKTANFNRQKVLRYTLVLSSFYLSWTFVSKGVANHNFVQQLDNQGIKYEKLLVSPTPLNTILWHGIAKTADGYYFGTYSLFDSRDEIEFQFESSAFELVSKIEKNRLGKYYLDYTQDFPLIKSDINGDIKIYAVKYGPINYFGKPEFVYPLSLNLNQLLDENISIDYSGKKRGPVKNYKKLFKRIRGF